MMCCCTVHLAYVSRSTEMVALPGRCREAAGGPKLLMFAVPSALGLLRAATACAGVSLNPFIGALQGKRLHSPTLWLGAAGLGFMAVLMAKRVKGALMLGIVATTAISWIPGHAASYLGAGSQVPGG